jgi:hypothetical protein
LLFMNHLETHNKSKHSDLVKLSLFWQQTQKNRHLHQPSV